MPSRMWAGGAAALSPIRACANSFMDVFSRVFGHAYKLSEFLCSQRRNLVCYLFQPLYASNLLGRGIEVKVYVRHSETSIGVVHGFTPLPPARAAPQSTDDVICSGLRPCRKPGRITKRRCTYRSYG